MVAIFPCKMYSPIKAIFQLLKSFHGFFPCGGSLGSWDELEGETQHQLGGRRQLPAGSKVMKSQVVGGVEVLVGGCVPQHPLRVLAGGGEEVRDKTIVLFCLGLLEAF